MVDAENTKLLIIKVKRRQLITGRFNLKGDYDR